MWLTLLRLASRRPRLLAAYAQASAGLLLARASLMATAWRRRARLEAIALVSGGVAALLGGTALLLWAALPEGSMPRPWLLLAVPIAPLVLTLMCVGGARRAAGEAGYAPMLAQLRADASRLHAAAESLDEAARLALLPLALQLLLDLALRLHPLWQRPPRAHRGNTGGTG